MPRGPPAGFCVSPCCWWSRPSPGKRSPVSDDFALDSRPDPRVGVTLEAIPSPSRRKTTSTNRFLNSLLNPTRLQAGCHRIRHRDSSAARSGRSQAPYTNKLISGSNGGRAVQPMPHELAAQRGDRGIARLRCDGPPERREPVVVFAGVRVSNRQGTIGLPMKADRWQKERRSG